VSSPHPSQHRTDRFSEAILLTLVVVAPWLYGSVEAWAQLPIFAGVAAITIFGLADASGARSPWRSLRPAPSLALLGLALLAGFQALPWSEGLFDWVAPQRAALREALLPESPERLLGDPDDPVPLAKPTISLIPEHSAHAAGGFLTAWLIYLAVQRFKGFGSYRRFATVAVANAAALTIFSVIQGLTWNGRVYWMRESPFSKEQWAFTGGPFVYHGPLAAYLNLGLGLAIGFLLGAARNGSKNVRTWSLYGTGLLAFGVVFSQSRGGMVAMAAATVLIAALARIWKRGRGGATIALGAVGLAAVFLLALGSAFPSYRIASILDTAGHGYQARLSLWNDALKAWTASPIWGAGFGTFEAAVSPDLSVDRSLVFKRAENEYLDVLIEGGLVGLGLLGVLIGSVAWRAGRAWRTTLEGTDAMLVLGGIFGLTALAIHSLVDFSPHIPGLGLTALVLAAHLCRLGAPAAEREAVSETVASRKSPKSRSRRLAATGEGSAAPAGLGMAIQAVLILPALGVLGQGWTLARSELALSGSNVPLADPLTRPNRPRGENATYDRLDRDRQALERALDHRPAWAAGHLRLALTHLGLYEAMARQWIAEVSESLEANELEAASPTLSDPLWLHDTMHSEQAQALSTEELLAQEPVRRHLIPAARSFLEARRRSPVLAHTHGWLAGLDYLIVGQPDGSVYLERALRLAGPDSALLMMLARLAVQIEEIDLATTCWRRALEVNPDNWDEIATLAPLVPIEPERLLTDVLPSDSGELALRFAEHFAEDPEHASAVPRFAQAALDRLPVDASGDEAERLERQARALALLDRRDEAIETIEIALGLAPNRVDWRRETVAWLVDWGRFDEAIRQARIGLTLAPGDRELTQLQDQAAEQLAQGSSDSAPSP